MIRSSKEQVLEQLQTLSVCEPDGSNLNWTVRCPYCGDSMNLSHGHFSIRIDLQSDDLIVYHCHRCDAGGVLTPDVLADLELGSDEELMASLRHDIRHSMKIHRWQNQEKESYAVPLFPDTPSNQEKLGYLSLRLGTNFSLEDAQSCKIVLNALEFFKFNELEPTDLVPYSLLRSLSGHFVGFLSNNNNLITFRNIHSEHYRYRKIILNPNNINGNTFYSIPNPSDLLDVSPIHLHIAEGTFDILSIYANLEDRNLDRHYYYAACGFGYRKILRYLIYNGMNTNLTIHLYLDKDKTDRELERMLQRDRILHWADAIRFHRNSFPKEKDFGVPLSRISDAIRRIK